MEFSMSLTSLEVMSEFNDSDPNQTQCLSHFGCLLSWSTENSWLGCPVLRLQQAIKGEEHHLARICLARRQSLRWLFLNHRRNGPVFMNPKLSGPTFTQLWCSLPTFCKPSFIELKATVGWLVEALRCPRGIRWVTRGAMRRTRDKVGTRGTRWTPEREASPARRMEGERGGATDGVFYARHLCIRGVAALARLHHAVWLFLERSLEYRWSHFPPPRNYFYFICRWVSKLAAQLCCQTLLCATTTTTKNLLPHCRACNHPASAHGRLQASCNEIKTSLFSQVFSSHPSRHS